MSARSKARKRALDALFEADQRDADVLTVLSRTEASAQEPMNPYVREIVEGIVAHRAAIDETIETYSEAWPLDRMPAVDRALARIAVYEIVFNAEVPDPVAIDEIVALAGELSTDESPAFLNGLLSRIASVKHRLNFD